MSSTMIGVYKILSSTPYNNPRRQILLLSPFHRWENWETKIRYPMSRFKTSSSLTLEPKPLNTIPYLSPTKTKGKDMGNETLP